MKTTETTTRTTTNMRIKHRDPTYLKYLEQNPEAETMEPDGIETVRKQSANIGGGTLDKRYSDIGTGIGVIEGRSVDPATQGGQFLPQKPTEPTATIGDDNLGAGESALFDTFPYPTNPDASMGVSENAVMMPKLQASGPPQDSYGVRNSMSNTGNFGAVADNQLNAVVERVEAAIMAEITSPKDPMTLECGSTLPIKQDGNEAVAPNGAMIQPNGVSGFPARTQIPQQTPKSEEVTAARMQGANAVEEWKSEEVGDDYHFPYIIAFDWNGTIDARNTGRGIPIQVLQDLQRRGKKVLVFTSSTQGADKDFMRQTLDQLSIPYTDDERGLTDVDMLIGDKKSDEKRAGRYGVKFIDVNDFSIDKVLQKSVSFPGMNRTAIGDSWNGNVNDYRENSLPLIMNTPSQKDILTQLLGSSGFLSNEIGVQPVGSRFEHKMGGAIAKIEGSQDNQRLEITITDRTGRPELVADDWASLYAYLQQKFPREDD